MSRDEKETPLSKFVSTLGRLLPKFERRELPLSRLDNARMALDGAAVPLPNSAGPQLPTKLYGGVNEVALAADGTRFVTGKRHGRKGEKVVLLRAMPGSDQFEEVDSAPVIERLFVPEGSNKPAYMRAIERGVSHAEWVWNGLTLPGDQNDMDTRPLFWTNDQGINGAVITKGKLYVWHSGQRHIVGLPHRYREYKPTHIQLISKSLFQIWGLPAHQDVVVWRDKVGPAGMYIDRESVVRGVNAEPWFLARANAAHGPVHVCNMDGLERMLEHKPEGIWTAPGKIFVLEETLTGPDGPSCRVHEVISGWSSDLLDQQVEQVWALSGHSSDIALHNRNSGVLRYLSESSSVIGQAPAMSRASVRQMGNLFVYQIGDTFAFLKDTNIEFSAHRIPRQELGLEHLVLMNDGTIQGIVKSGTSVVTYTFFDPSKRA